MSAPARPLAQALRALEGELLVVAGPTSR